LQEVPSPRPLSSKPLGMCGFRWSPGDTLFRAKTNDCTERDSQTMDATFLVSIPWKSVILGAILIFLVIGGWTWFVYRSDPERGTIDSPDATAFLRGRCGDAMKISLTFSRDRVVEAKYWTDGCRMSSACGSAAARLALHKTAEEIADIDYVAIEKEVGCLPEEDLHCATLAAGTLQEAIRIYLVGGETDSPSTSNMQPQLTDSKQSG
jgi:nitrogen fixation protein NifU and related proteins